MTTYGFSRVKKHQKHQIHPQQGVSLIIVMMILIIVSLLGVAGMQISTMSERGARNDRDQQVAWQSAEAALVDAEYDIYGPVVVSNRRATFTPTANLQAFADGCGTGVNAGLCSLVSTGKPAWLTVDFTATGSSAPTAAYGSATNRSFTAGGLGVQPAQAPRYIVEPIPDPGYRNRSDPEPAFVYRVTAMGFGPKTEIQAVLQMIYRD